MTADPLTPRQRRSLIVCEPHRCIYCVVPKAACSNWIMLLRRLCGFEDYADASLLYAPADNGLTYVTLDEAMATLNLDRCFKFTFVRNPFTRLLSAWRNKFDPTAGRINEVWLDYARGIRRELGSADTDGPGPLSFRDFIRFAALQSVEEMPLHWAPQTRITGIDRFPYDFIGRVENMADGFEMVRTRVGFDFDFPSRQDLWFHPPSNADHRLSRAYTPELVALVAETFRADFDAFGYPTTIPGIASEAA